LRARWNEWATSMTRMRMGFSDKNLGSNWVKMGSFSFFEKVEIGEIVNVYWGVCIF
jgi:hypothetical protein